MTGIYTTHFPLCNFFFNFQSDISPSSLLSPKAIGRTRSSSSTSLFSLFRLNFWGFPLLLFHPSLHFLCFIPSNAGPPVLIS